MKYGLIFLLLFGQSCTPPKKETPKPTWSLQSSSFTNGGTIPNKYACSGVNNFPTFTWTGQNTNVKSYAMICDDPDAVPVAGYVWIHWVLFNIPANTTAIAENNSKIANIGTGIHGTTSFGDTLYGGPCPPAGQTHTYNFTLYATDLSKLPGLSSNATAAAVRAAMKGHILDSVVYKGKFGR